MRLSRRIPLGERFSSTSSPTPSTSSTAPTLPQSTQLCDPWPAQPAPPASDGLFYDARQFQFALKVSW